MLVGIMATLKVGAAYVPQDARIAPLTQLQNVAEAAQTRVILTLAQFAQAMPSGPGIRTLNIDEIHREDSFGHLAYARVKSQSTCFVLFTSGTTGKPNGVRVTHQNLCNILTTEPGRLGMRPGLKVSQILNIAFDMAAWEVLGSLMHGATLVIRGKDIEETVRQVDIVIATPSILASLNADQCRQVCMVAVAGEPCPRTLADKWSEFASFYNSCGPTEVTIVNTMHLYLPASEQFNIGSPTPNNTVYILDENLQPCAIGEVGEMWGGGDCVTAGYLNSPDLNRERYVLDPFIGDGSHMFRTRDLGRWTDSGELEHLGRTDDQVKIRGFRVELDSVSASLETDPNCSQAVVLKVDPRHLVAFVCSSDFDEVEAKARVAQLLPYYCVPTRIIKLEEFPRTDRGKIDKRSLTELAAKVLERIHA